MRTIGIIGPYRFPGDGWEVEMHVLRSTLYTRHLMEQMEAAVNVVSFHMMYPRFEGAGLSEASIMTAQRAFVARCSEIHRLPGHSDGADQEESIARELGIPVHNVSREVLQRICVEQIMGRGK